MKDDKKTEKKQEEDNQQEEQQGTQGEGDPAEPAGNIYTQPKVWTASKNGNSHLAYSTFVYLVITGEEAPAEE